jgi:hypothetical protein
MRLYLILSLALSPFGTGLFYATPHRFRNSKFFEHIKYITPLPITFNYWLIKVLFKFLGVMCVVLGLYGVFKPFL